MGPSPDQGAQKVSVNMIPKPGTRDTIFLRQLITERIMLYYSFFRNIGSAQGFSIALSAKQ
jgi:hypothetical protein